MQFWKDFRWIYSSDELKVVFHQKFPKFDEYIFWHFLAFQSVCKIAVL